MSLIMIGGALTVGTAAVSAVTYGVKAVRDRWNAATLFASKKEDYLNAYTNVELWKTKAVRQLDIGDPISQLDGLLSGELLKTLLRLEFESQECSLTLETLLTELEPIIAFHKEYAELHGSFIALQGQLDALKSQIHLKAKSADEKEQVLIAFQNREKWALIRTGYDSICLQTNRWHEALRDPNNQDSASLRLKDARTIIESTKQLIQKIKTLLDSEEEEDDEKVPPLFKEFKSSLEYIQQALEDRIENITSLNQQKFSEDQLKATLLECSNVKAKTERWKEEVQKLPSFITVDQFNTLQAEADLLKQTIADLLQKIEPAKVTHLECTETYITLVELQAGMCALEPIVKEKYAMQEKQRTSPARVHELASRRAFSMRSD